LEQRVYQAINELGYRPNVYARSLKTNRSHILGVHVPDITNPFFSEGVKVIQNVAASEGYQIVLYDSDNKLENEQKNIQGMLNTQVDGIIDIAPRTDIHDLLAMVDIPLVVVDRPPLKTERNVAFVYADNYRGAASVADYLIGKGYRRFYCMAGPVQLVANAQARLAGFTETLKHHGMPDEACQVYYGDFTFDSGFELMQKALKGYEPKGQPAAAFVGSDIMAWGAMEAIKEKKLKMPRDMGIVGYDNIYFSSFLYPKLTTVENPIREMAGNAANLMLDALERRRNLLGFSVALRSALMVRKSC
jgi:DNA-binding LacI/PurR family transcriptional regulator